MDVAAAGDGGEIVEGFKFAENDEALQDAQIEGGAAYASAGEADSFESKTGRDGIDIFVAVLCFFGRPVPSCGEFLLEEPLPWRILHYSGEAGLGSGIGQQGFDHLCFAGASERKRILTEDGSPGRSECLPFFWSVSFFPLISSDLLGEAGAISPG